MWDIEGLIKGTQLIVEANSYERMTLWELWKDRTEWVQVLEGEGVEVGKLNKRPVFIQLSWAVIRGVAVCFLEPTSELVDWKMIDKWLTKTFPGIRKLDAMNFGPGSLNGLPHLQRPAQPT